MKSIARQNNCHINNKYTPSQQIFKIVFEFNKFFYLEIFLTCDGKISNETLNFRVPFNNTKLKNIFNNINGDLHNKQK